MADPFSIVAGTVGLVDVCIRVVKCLKEIHAATKKIQDDIGLLIKEIESLEAISNSIQKTFRKELDPKKSLSGYGVDITSELWKHTGRSLQDCKSVIGRLEVLVKEIYGKNGPTVTSKLDAIAKSRRKKSVDDDFKQCREQLTTYQGGLNILLTTINL